MVSLSAENREQTENQTTAIDKSKDQGIAAVHKLEIEELRQQINESKSLFTFLNFY